MLKKLQNSIFSFGTLQRWKSTKNKNELRFDKKRSGFSCTYRFSTLLKIDQLERNSIIDIYHEIRQNCIQPQNSKEYYSSLRGLLPVIFPPPPLQSDSLLRVVSRVYFRLKFRQQPIKLKFKTVNLPIEGIDDELWYSLFRYSHFSRNFREKFTTQETPNETNGAKKQDNSAESPNTEFDIFMTQSTTSLYYLRLSYLGVKKFSFIFTKFSKQIELRTHYYYLIQGLYGDCIR